MKYILRILIVLFISFIIYGYYLNSLVGKSGDKWIGIGVLIMAFVLMPLFLWSRYKNKKLTDFKLDPKLFNPKNTDNQ
jgi:hypothetical protein